MDVQLTGRPEDAPQVTLHHLPCTVDYDGPAEVGRYLVVGSGDTQVDALRTAFRGRTLHGQLVPVPEGYTGVVLREDRLPLTDMEDRQFRVHATFPAIHYWRHSQDPTQSDPLPKALAWSLVANA
eukprot:Ihof_evm7s142 gene=Ihof_evmTU7s142